MSEFNGLGLHLGNLSRLSRAKTRSISPENFTGEKGKGGMSTDGPAASAARGLGQGGIFGGFRAKLLERVHGRTFLCERSRPEERPRDARAIARDT